MNLPSYFFKQVVFKKQNLLQPLSTRKPTPGKKTSLGYFPEKGHVKGPTNSSVRQPSNVRMVNPPKNERMCPKKGPFPKGKDRLPTTICGYPVTEPKRVGGFSPPNWKTCGTS